MLWVSSKHSNALRANQEAPSRKRSLMQGCNIETLPEFPVCWAAFWISDSRCNTISCLSFQLPACPGLWSSCPYNHMSRLLKINPYPSSILLSIDRSIDRTIYLTSVSLCPLGSVSLENLDWYTVFLGFLPVIRLIWIQKIVRSLGLNLLV